MAEPGTTEKEHMPQLQQQRAPKNNTIAADENDDEGEIRWTDDKIRWTEDNDKTNDGNDEEEEETAYIDPFKDPDPFDTFSFRFQLKKQLTDATTAADATTEKNHNSESNEWIELAVRGYKTDSDQVWQSTGLTLWRASEHLCHYMTQHSELFQNTRILEVSQ